MSKSRREIVISTLSRHCFETGEERVLHSGRTSRYFVDVPRIIEHPLSMTCLMKLLSSFLFSPTVMFDGMISPDFGGTFIAIALQQYLTECYGLDIPVYRFLKEGRLNQNPVVGMEYVIIDDVITTGSSVLPIIQEVQKIGANISHVITVVNRQEGEGEKILRNQGISLTSVCTLEEVLSHDKEK